MILMKPESFAGLNTLEGLQRALQEAIELEHATIPPYLYALFSLEPGNNTEITQLVDSVVKDEMAHMALACNILNAIAGEPELDTPRVIPTYPGHLPGAVEDQLIVHLRPFSIAQVEKTFMVIEEPEEPLVIPDEAMPERRTIGAFYAIIKREIEALGQSIFKGDPNRQVTGGFHEIIAVTDVKSASAAIETIVEQGEGTSKSPLGDQAGDELAHYYRFAEIVHGKKLIRAQGQNRHGVTTAKRFRSTLRTFTPSWKTHAAPPIPPARPRATPAKNATTPTPACSKPFTRSSTERPAISDRQSIR